MCDSGLYHEAVYDARGIYVGKVCEKCKDETLGGYRPELFTDPAMWSTNRSMRRIRWRHRSP